MSCEGPALPVCPLFRKESYMVRNEIHSKDIFPSRPRLSRRTFMAGASAAGVAGTHLGSITTPAAARQETSFSGKIRMEAHDYTPSESMEKTADNPIPHDALQRMADAYIEM